MTHIGIPMMKPKQLSIVLPIYNEEETLPLLRQRLTEALKRVRVERELAVEIVLVDDGSADGSYRFLETWAGHDPTVKVVKLSRNFGHQAAITAGLDAATGDAVVMMDADLQDPPEIIEQLLAKQAEGFEVVYARRTARAGESLFKRATAWLFYRLMKSLVHRDLPQDTGDFRLVSGRAQIALRDLRERHRFLRGMSTWIGFRQVDVTYERSARAAGTTKFSTLKMVRFAWNAAISFSSLPLTLVTLWGGVVSLFGLGYLVYTVYRYFVFRDTVPGWATLVVLLCLIGGSILVSLGIIGSYIGKIFEEIKERPLYIIQRSVNCNHGAEHDGAIATEGRGERRTGHGSANEGVDIPRYVGIEH